MSPAESKKCILALESSCDETSAACISLSGDILSNVVRSQIEIHVPYGGVVPELAARAHEEYLLPTIHLALDKAQRTLDDVVGIAVCQGPGLASCLILGLTCAQALSYSLGVPLIGVNHLLAHVQACFVDEAPLYPVIAGVFSGGHTQVYQLLGEDDHRLMGETQDDAVGECFDKVARLLGLGYPGGPAIEREALKGDINKYKLPHPMLHHTGYNFSFSGLKTAVKYLVESLPEASIEHEVVHIAASFQHKVAEILTHKIFLLAQDVQARQIVVGGGVTINKYIRNMLQEEAKKNNIDIIVPDRTLCTDNAGMIGLIGLELYKKERFLNLDSEIKTRWNF